MLDCLFYLPPRFRFEWRPHGQGSEWNAAGETSLEEHWLRRASTATIPFYRANSNACLRLFYSAFEMEVKVDPGRSALYELVRKVPKRRVISYGALARGVRLRGGARAAGRAMWACPKGWGIPWHRVVGAAGRILLAEPQAGMQRRLLESEGVQFTGHRIDMSKYEWEPRSKKAGAVTGKIRKRAQKRRRRPSSRRRSSRPPRNVV
jgi:methylated-DNA-protein-cysteine methyltransferase-like protein